MTTSLRYRDAGVNIDAGNELVETIKPIAKASQHPNVLANLGGFNALYQLPQGYNEPVLVSCTDGVGTKILLAKQLHQYDTIGIDLVAMCANDLIVSGAEPLYFLDYYATGRLDVAVASAVIAGIGDGCRQANLALIGGETAEMPGVYQNDDYDLAGFAVGVVEKADIIDGLNIRPGDALIAIPSTGPHSNGYSLIRKILSDNQIDLGQAFENSTLGNHLLTPTKIYVNCIEQLRSKITVLGMAHITGGGLLENIPRMLPADCQALINASSWELSPIFQWLQEQGQLSNDDMHITFNCGVGMICCIRAEDVELALQCLTQARETAWQIGEIRQRVDGAKPIAIV